MRVLVVEDTAVLRELLSAHLAKCAGVQVVGYASCEESALSAAKLLMPDLVTLDLGLESGSGVSVLRRLRVGDFAGHILIFSSELFETHGRRCLALGANGYFCKADGHVPLIAAIEQLLVDRRT